MSLIPSKSYNDELSVRVHRTLSRMRRELTAVQVVADGETIELNGVVPSFHLRQLAIEAARHTPGVRTISDSLEVR
jgi:osmotically-inducible protein OsmY